MLTKSGKKTADGDEDASRPEPPVSSKQKDVRYFHIREDDELDEKQFADWVKQASMLPGEKM